MSPLRGDEACTAIGQRFCDIASRKFASMASERRAGSRRKSYCFRAISVSTTLSNEVPPAFRNVHRTKIFISDFGWASPTPSQGVHSEALSETSLPDTSGSAELGSSNDSRRFPKRAASGFAISCQRKEPLGKQAIPDLWLPTLSVGLRFQSIAIRGSAPSATGAPNPVRAAKKIADRITALFSGAGIRRICRRLGLGCGSCHAVSNKDSLIDLFKCVLIYSRV